MRIDGQVTPAEDGRSLGGGDHAEPATVARVELAKASAPAFCRAAVSGLILVFWDSDRMPGRHGGVALASFEAAAVPLLMRCMPAVPCGYRDDFGFEQRYLDHALPALEWRCRALVLGPVSQDAAHAAELVDCLTECAMAIASDFCAPDFAEHGFLEVGAVLAFIESWRENVTSSLAQATVGPKG